MAKEPKKNDDPKTEDPKKNKGQPPPPKTAGEYLESAGVADIRIAGAICRASRLDPKGPLGDLKPKLDAARKKITGGK